MKKYELKDIDPEDIEDLILKIESSFNIKFGDTELIHVSTFGELCDILANKIQLENSNDCTSQQAFYKLRDAISSTLQIDKNKISTDCELQNILPRQSRKSRIKKIENHLGFNINLLRPPHWLTTTLAIILLGSLIALFFNTEMGLLGLLFSMIGLWLSFKTANELDVNTVGELVKKITRENYLKSRRNPNTFNRNEIEKVLIDWFSYDLDINENKLTRDAKFT